MISYQIESNYHLDEMLALYRASGINRPIDDPLRMSRLLSGADILLCARDNGKLVGLARVLSDGAWVSYIADLLVDQAYQQQGIGKTLLAQLHQHAGPEVQQLLLAAPSAQTYYPKVGYQSLTNAFAIQREC